MAEEGRRFLRGARRWGPGFSSRVRVRGITASWRGYGFGGVAAGRSRAMQRGPAAQHQRSPFAIQELLGLSDAGLPASSSSSSTHHGNSQVSSHAVTAGLHPSVLGHPPGHSLVPQGPPMHHPPPHCGFPGDRPGVYLGHAFVPCAPFLHGFDGSGHGVPPDVAGESDVRERVSRAFTYTALIHLAPLK